MSVTFVFMLKIAFNGIHCPLEHPLSMNNHGWACLVPKMKRKGNHSTIEIIYPGTIPLNRDTLLDIKYKDMKLQ
ncbi:hypothetical protein XI25_10155 [Paenibacillus sp. DMB20]|nr:hypothetical protein XI25_10155 [Paenibacillus sp. DMB20]